MVIVGGGMLGTMHAVTARRRGLAIAHLEREHEARGASVRNFGLVWVSGRRAGPELRLALRARELWDELGARRPGPASGPPGSLHPRHRDAELALLKEAAGAAGRGTARLRAARRGGVREVNPALRGGVRRRAALPGRRDRRAAAVLPALRGTWPP